MSGCSRTVLRVYLVASALLIVAGNMISAFVLFRIPNALLESFPGLDCFEGPCKGFSGSTEEDFVVPSASLSASASSIATRQSRWGPDAGWLLNIVALGATPPTSPFLSHSSNPSFQIVKTFFLPLLQPFISNCQNVLPSSPPPLHFKSSKRSFFLFSLSHSISALHCCSFIRHRRGIS
jgi:hypothetical protein